jgi:leucyl aminopeptidase
MKTRFAAPALPSSGLLVMLAGEGAALPAVAAKADKAFQDYVRRAFAAANFEGKRDQVADLLAPVGLGVSRLIVVGVGDPTKLKAREAELTGGTIGGLLLAAKAKEAAVLTDLAGEPALPAGQVAALVASGIGLRCYAFDKYKTVKPNDKPKLEQVSVLTGEAAAARKAWASLDAVNRGVALARDLVNEPANMLYPATLADRAKELVRLGVTVDILTPREMKKLGMGAFLGVAQGSEHEGRMIVMHWKGGKAGAAPLAFIGKAVTFDTGGISIKPAAGMEDMKGDMAGGACVVGLMAALAGRKAKANVVGVVAAAENMPSGAAQRPGDVVKSMSGQTIAVLNTDAEGRLILADAMWYCQDRFKPAFMIDLATLTGAILVALGKEHAGLFSNNDELSQRLSEAGVETGEKVWRLPLAPEYDKLIDTDVADMKNIGGRNAGSITAAQFLQRFVNNVPWAHLDIAGTGMDAPKSAINPSWGSGWGVKLLNRLVEAHYER